MKVFTLLLLSCILLTCGPTEAPTATDLPTGGATVSGRVAGGAGEYITLFYASRLRGNLNPDGFRTKGMRMEPDGAFHFTVDQVTEGGNYALRLKNGFYPLILSAGDVLSLTLDPTNPDATIIAAGTGAGKINFQRLDQLDLDYGYIVAPDTPVAFAARADSVVAAHRRILETVYAGDVQSPVVTGASNQADLEHLMTQTPLSPEEYSYLDQLLRLRRFTFTESWLSGMADDPKLAALPIDGQAFPPFDDAASVRLNHINDFRLANGLEAVLTLEHVKDLSRRSDTPLTYGDWRERLWQDSGDWNTNFLRENFPDNIYTSYYSALAGWMLTMGQDPGQYYARLDPAADGAFTARLQQFEHLLERGTRLEQGLEADSLILDQPELRALLDRYAGQELLINFWSAEFAGSSIVDDIPLMQDFQARNRGKLAVINICVDSLRHKDLWAARIIDSDWDAEHYFVPIEGNDGLLNDFTARNLATFCEGGASQAYIDAQGTIFQEINAPFYKLADEIAREVHP
ncbi:hypothetical protein [Lewinella sp. IMCC34183]|uniref:hypothetical protein n=1 Tax=Lewinella sp. IMCC34183 TaxID=2248762 RepID=UPI000E24975F|nr:hypothetical protein [Lewinella sp. IMCC34183]